MIEITARIFVEYATTICRDYMNPHSVPFQKNGGSIRDGMDCGGFIENCLRHFGVTDNYNGSNDLFRNAGQHLFSLDYATQFDLVKPGVLCFIANQNFSDLPSEYLNDGKLNADCVGVCIGNRKVLWYSRTDECFKTASLADKPQYERHFWTHILLCNHIDYSEFISNIPVNGVTTPTQQSTLRKGDNGPGVARLQEKLKDHGFVLDQDGSFGSITQQAVITFQKNVGLEADGIVGSKTWAALDA